jgi:polynucleotide 5'-hydroxyl-kinase GRC3/NOL9
MNPIVLLPEWERLDRDALVGTTVVIGSSDAGKSTFVRWLVSELAARHSRVAWIDTDVGQSTLFLPTTMSLAVLEGREAGLAALEVPPAPDAVFFVGDTSPRGHMLPMVVGARRLLDEAHRRGVTAVVVDTGGMITRDSGAMLKRWKLELLTPSHAIALERKHELAHLIPTLAKDRRLELTVLPVAGAVSSRSPEARARRRRAQLQAYFEAAQPVTIDVSRLPVFQPERATPHRLVAVQDAQGFALALGLLVRSTPNALTLVAPPFERTRVASVAIGNLAFDRTTGKELR